MSGHIPWLAASKINLPAVSPAVRIERLQAIGREASYRHGGRMGSSVARAAARGVRNRFRAAFTASKAVPKPAAISMSCYRIYGCIRHGLPHSCMSFLAWAPLKSGANLGCFVPGLLIRRLFFRDGWLDLKSSSSRNWRRWQAFSPDHVFVFAPFGWQFLHCRPSGFWLPLKFECFYHI